MFNNINKAFELHSKDNKLHRKAIEVHVKGAELHLKRYFWFFRGSPFNVCNEVGGSFLFPVHYRVDTRLFNVRDIQSVPDEFLGRNWPQRLWIRPVVFGICWVQGLPIRLECLPFLVFNVVAFQSVVKGLVCVFLVDWLRLRSFNVVISALKQKGPKRKQAHFHFSTVSDSKGTRNSFPFKENSQTINHNGKSTKTSKRDLPAS